MKRITNIWICTALFLVAQSYLAAGQAVNEDRMNRDIEVGENVLATLIKQELGQNRTIFGLDVKGSYQPGYGVTFRLPPDHTFPFVISIGGDRMNGASVISNGMSYRYSISSDDSSEPKIADEDGYKLKEKSKTTADSLESEYNAQMIQAATNFILDYGDLLSQLGAQEKIVVTNQTDRPRFFNPGRRTRISVEGTRSDIAALKEGKISREQAVKKLKIINTESVETRDADLEILSSIFTRLYHPDVSKTYFIDGNVYYERLKDYGAVYYMQMISSIERNLNRFFLPTQGLDNLNQEARDKKVAELYPVFEQEMKENILEYGRTLKSLKDDELLIFNISLTKCTGCSIPATLELSVPASALKDFGSGKIDKASALRKITEKKGANQ
ncbi:MAG TPA: hypothetical protein VFI14_00370 [Chryseosolibacter sp.]|jgi:hypothetical protein|nr:hypothetical protein [Chryseosolibacter sp.]